MTSEGTGGGPVLLTDVVDRIGTITLNRPACRNALDGELIVALDQAVHAMADDDGVKVVILTGAGADGSPVGFCSGGDVKAGRRSPGSEVGVPLDALSGDLSRHDRHASMLLHLMPKPTIAMVGGPAIGAGCSLAAACDLRFASEDAVFATNFSPNGLSGDYGGTFFWTRIAGTATARRLYLLNEKLSARQALDLGMVHVVLPRDDLLDYTMQVARQLLRTPATLLALMKANLNEAEDEADRRRWLLGHESVNQAEAGRHLAERLARRSTPPGP